MLCMASSKPRSVYIQESYSKSNALHRYTMVMCACKCRHVHAHMRHICLIATFQACMDKALSILDIIICKLSNKVL